MGGRGTLWCNSMANRYKSSLFRSLQAFLILFLISCGSSSPDSKESPTYYPGGFSAFAALHDDFPCDAYLELANLSIYPMMPVLYGTFGTNFACVAKFTYANRNRPHVVEVHFSNEACRRNKRCFEGELLGNLTVEAYNSLLEKGIPQPVRGRLEEIEAKVGILANSNTQIILTTGLEDQFTESAFRGLYGYLQESGYMVIRSPLKGGVYEYPIELHGRLFNCQRGIIASNDGVQLGVSEARGYGENTSACGASVFWDCELQGSCGAFSRPNSRRFLISGETTLAWKEFLGGLYGMAF